jgi:predicted transcriptional regulator
MNFENTTVTGIENAIIGLRLPMSKSFEDAKSKSDSVFIPGAISQIKIGDDDLRIINNLLRADGCGRAGEPNSKFMRMIHVQVAITAPSYFMAELDTYKIGTVRNSTSVQHKGVSRAYSINDFEVEPDVLEVLTEKDREIITLTYPYETNEYRIYTCENGRKYKVFKNGRIISCAYSLTDSTGRTRQFEEKECVPSATPSGYFEINIGGRNGEKWLLHRLIATCWIDNPDKLSTVDHINTDKGDNSVENLEWVTLEENIRREWQNHKGFDKQKAYKNWKASSKTMPPERMRIRDLYKNGMSQKEIAEFMQMSQAQISVILSDSESTSKNKDLFEMCYYWEELISTLNSLREKYLETKDYSYFRAIRQILPMSFKYTSMFDCNYATLRNIYAWRRNHKLSEWHKFCDWICTLPLHELITAGTETGDAK